MGRFPGVTGDRRHTPGVASLGYMQNPGGELRGVEVTAEVCEPSSEIVEEFLVEEISIDGMCGVY